MTLPTSSKSSGSNPVAIPAPATRESDHFIAQFTNRLEEISGRSRRGRLPLNAAPDAAQRAWLEGRRLNLLRGLAPAPRQEAMREVLLLLASKAQFGADAEELTVKAGFYAQSLAEQPIWAIMRARLRFRQPGWRCLWDGKGCPSDVDVVAECRHETLPIETELAKIQSILDAEIYDNGNTDADRANAVAHWQSVKAEMREDDPDVTASTDEEISPERAAMARTNDRFRERDRAHATAAGRDKLMWGRLPISDELARQLGLRAPAEVE